MSKTWRRRRRHMDPKPCGRCGRTFAAHAPTSPHAIDGQCMGYAQRQGDRR